MAKLSIVIMAHRSREKFFPYLREKLGDIPFSIDEFKGQPGHIGVWENRKRAMLMGDMDSDFILTVQDDAIVCKNFRERAEKLLTSKEWAYSFYFGNRIVHRGLAKEGMKKGFIISRWTNWGLALCLPTGIIRETIQFCDGLTSRCDDTRIGTFLKHKGIKVYFPMPSLIDHRTGEASMVGHRTGMESLVGDPGANRKAAYFIDNENKPQN